MRLEVALAPALLGEARADRVCLVVDVLRASSSLVVMFQRGVREVAVAPSVEEARRLARELGEGWLLCGEVGGLPPPGFHYGNSPSQFSRLELGGRRVVFATSNGTRALAQVAAPLVLAGALLNATAAARAALAAAAPTQGVAIVCAGEEGGRAFALEDAIGAGAIVAAMAEQSELELSDGARAALALYQAHQGDLAAALALSEHGRQVARLGLAEDLAFCARRDLYPLVPRLERDRAGRLVLRPTA